MPGIDEFNLGGGGSPASPQDVYPLMERMIASMDSAADRIGANIRQSMMTNQANQQAKSMASQATQLLQNPQTSTNPTALLTGMMQIATNNPLGSQVAGGQTVLQTLGSRAQALQQAAAIVNPYYTPPGGTASQPQAGGQPTGVGALDTANGGIASGVVPSGSGSPSGMIPTAPTAGPMAQPNVQVNGQAMPPTVMPGQSAGAVSTTQPDPATQAVQMDQSQVAQATNTLNRLLQNPHAKAADVERAQAAQQRAGDKLSTLLNQQGTENREDSRQDKSLAERDKVLQTTQDAQAQRQKDWEAQQTRLQQSLTDSEKRTADAEAKATATEHRLEITAQLGTIRSQFAQVNAAVQKKENNLLYIKNQFALPGVDKKALQAASDLAAQQLVPLYAQQKSLQDQMTSLGNELAGIPAKLQAATAGTSKPLDAATAQQFLQQAGGDKDKARDLAKQAGYTF